MTRTILICLAAVAALAGSAAVAQEYPTRGPIRLVVGFATGGGTDAIARSLNVRLGEILKQTVLVENRPSSGGILGTEAVAKSAPDGYTVSFNVNTHAINQALYPKLPYDTERDLRGVTLIGSLGQMLAAHPNAQAGTLQQFLKLEAPNDDKKRILANGGVGSPGHLAAAYLESLAGARFTHVPYRGAGPGIIDVLGGQVPYILSTSAGLLPHVRAGKLKAIAVTSAERSSLTPQVPTIAESGFPGYDMDTWIATFVPKATPNSVVKLLHEATLEALKSPLVKERIEAQAGRIIGGSPAQLDALVAEDIKRYTKIVKDFGIKAE
ncbi:MAG: tripartite tricarboxylate transporter substrate binding protein [Betaproteobacteria bacterium]|nr:tripartite tricarboxylate transporter substrate binding protein [Betaproteobacteria bacterium]